MNGLSVTHLATSWPEGLQLLLAKKADPNICDDQGRLPIHCAIASGNVESVILLLRADSSLYTPPVMPIPKHDVIPFRRKNHDFFYRNVTLPTCLQLALALDSCGQKDIIVNEVVMALADRTTRLRDLALDVLPASKCRRMGISDSTLLGRQATSVFDALVEKGVCVPEALRPDHGGVYDTVNHHSRYQMTIDHANKLWEAGFKDVETPGYSGLSPILQSWYNGNVELVPWFQSKGVKIDSCSSNGRLGGLHLLARRCRYPYGEFCDPRPHIDATIVSRLQQDIDPSGDDCQCVCSTHGCTPTTILGKSDWLDFDRGKQVFNCWCEITKPNPDLLERYASDFIRVKVFEALKMSHTCCEFGHYYRRFYNRIDQVPPEIQEREKPLHAKLNSHMESYANERAEFTGLAEDFPKVWWEKWAETIRSQIIDS